MPISTISDVVDDRERNCGGDHKNLEIADTSSLRLGFNIDRKEENYTEEELATHKGSYPLPSEI